MFTPAPFAETDLIWLDRLMQRDAFVSLVSIDAEGLPQLNQLPVRYRRSGQQVVIEGHWAKANPQSRATGPVLIQVHGPHTYISPGWYPDKEAASRVPTWNYIRAELRGTLDRFDDPSELASLVDRLSRHYEARIDQDWRYDGAAPPFNEKCSAALSASASCPVRSPSSSSSRRTTPAQISRP